VKEQQHLLGHFSTQVITMLQQSWHYLK